MESPDVNPLRDNDEPLAALLRTRSSEIPDDGFSQRVLAALPRPASAPMGGGLRAALPMIAVTAGAIAGLVVAQRAGAFLRGDWSALERLAANAPVLFNPWLGLALGITAATLLFTVWLLHHVDTVIASRRPAFRRRWF